MHLQLKMGQDTAEYIHYPNKTNKKKKNKENNMTEQTQITDFARYMSDICTVNDGIDVINQVSERIEITNSDRLRRIMMQSTPRGNHDDWIYKYQSNFEQPAIWNNDTGIRSISEQEYLQQQGIEISKSLDSTYINKEKEHIADMIIKYTPLKFYNDNNNYDNSNTNNYTKVLENIINSYSSISPFVKTNYISSIMKSYSKNLIEDIITNFIVGNYFRKYQKSIPISIKLDGFDKDKIADNFTITLKHISHDIIITTTINNIDNFSMLKRLGDLHRNNYIFGRTTVYTQRKIDSKIFGTQNVGFGSENRPSSEKLNRYVNGFQEPDEIVELRGREEINEVEKLTSMIISNKNLIEELIKTFLNGNELKTMLELNKQFLDLTAKFGTINQYHEEFNTSIENIKLINKIINESRDI